MTPQDVYIADMTDFDYPLAELHAHLTAAIHPAVFWRIAQSQGFKLPKNNFRDFANYISLSVEKTTTMKEYFDSIYHPLLNPLSSGTYAVEQATYEIMSESYRVNNVSVIELRNNPMKHNYNNQIDLDHMIMAMLRGMERALLEYPALSAGLIFCLDRQFSYHMNEVIVRKAIKYRNRGVVGIDVANYDTGTFQFADYEALFNKAREAGLKITVHTGETDDTNDMWDVLRYARPQRIGHGIKAAYDPALMEELVKQNIVLEVCPISNIATNAVSGVEELRHIFQTLLTHDVPFCLNSDWPAMIREGNLRAQLAFIRQHELLSDEAIRRCNDTAFASSFVRGKGIHPYL